MWNCIRQKRDENILNSRRKTPGIFMKKDIENYTEVSFQNDREALYL